MPPILHLKWEIRKVVGKKRAGKGFEYRVRWKDTWLHRSELGNAQRLLQEYEAGRKAHRGPKPCKATRADKTKWTFGRIVWENLGQRITVEGRPQELR